MDTGSIRKVHTGTDNDALHILKQFNLKHAKAFSFPELTKETKQKLVEGVLEWLNRKASSQMYKTCLETLRILSREKNGLDCMTTGHALMLLVRHSGLESYAHENAENGNVTIQESGDFSVTIEAQKCLCNIVYNSQIAQNHCSKNGCIEGIIQRMKTYKDPELPFDIKYFDMRLLFLFTALLPETRLRIKSELHGFTYLMEVLDLVLEEQGHNTLSDDQVNLICELLKILFNVTITVDKNSLDEEEEAHCQRLVSILHDLLLSQTRSRDKAEELQSHTLNLLTNMPKSSYDELLTPINDAETETNEADMTSGDDFNVEYDGKNMAVIMVLLRFLNERLSEPKGSLKEKLAPTLHCFCELCRENRTIRKFCRIKILPPLRSEDVQHLPEEGNSLRSKLVKLFTSVVTEVKDLSADLCFVLCKENVGRFVKYTGYGNAAGLLAQRGLMCGGKTSGEYSSESDESDTEEYSKLEHDVNPMTGRWEPQQRPDPMAGMTEEQKEYEAMQLVNQFDKLARSGIIQPVVVGADGKPQVVENVHQLAQGMRMPPEGDESD